MFSRSLAQNQNVISMSENLSEFEWNETVKAPVKQTQFQTEWNIFPQHKSHLFRLTEILQS